MSQQQYRTAPVSSSQMPTGIPYIIGNEASERFSFYGMKAILLLFMTDYIRNSAGDLDVMKKEDAQVIVHLFVSFVYFTPLLGALLSDWLLGKYRTILILSIVYCLGHLSLAINSTESGLYIGLFLIGVGAGGIKPCVSAHVGDQFGNKNKHLLSKVFSWFYFSINVGAMVSMFLIPILIEKFGPHVAFGIPGILMLIATFFFWLGRKEFIHVPPRGHQVFKDLISEEGRNAIFKLIPLYLFVMVFWALFDQSATTWLSQAKGMDLHWLGYEWQKEQMQLINPLCILIFAPLFAYVVYPFINKYFPLTPMRKIGIGLFVTSFSFVICAFIQKWIDAGETPSIQWQVLAYIILTSAEIMVSITCLEFSYTQAPHSIKSIIMSIYLLSVTFGNLLTSYVIRLTSQPQFKKLLQGENYFWFFAGLMLITSLLFMVYARFYKEQTYIQKEAD